VGPRTGRRCRSFTLERPDLKLEPEADAELAAFQAVILDQDRSIAESQRPEDLPVGLSAELHIAGPDRAPIAFRRSLAELAGSEPMSAR
jgi:phenylpropionate dioxygenase-like ring-hydroxylating dioxygenase large terminal subunit